MRRKLFCGMASVSERRRGGTSVLFKKGSRIFKQRVQERDLTVSFALNYNMIMNKFFLPAGSNMKRKNTTIEDLAIMVKKGFDGVDKKFDGVDKKFDGVDKKFDEAQKDRDGIRREMREGFTRVNARLDVIEGDIKDFIGRDEFEDVLARLKLVEKTLGLKV
ncbi:MAG: hypothetical protein HY813_02145 [Candidatus Portnoybacteria bacterium]|nr:hypothetical protein [Candidatus Portnoybacteria bacterium]